MIHTPIETHKQIAADTNADTELGSIRRRVLRYVLVATSILFTSAIFSIIYPLHQTKNWFVLAMLSAAAAVLWTITLVESIPHPARAFLFLTILLATGVYLLVSSEIASSGLIILLILPLLAAFVMGWGQSVGVFILTVSIGIGLSYLSSYGLVSLKPMGLVELTGLAGWAWNGICFITAGAILLLGIKPLLNNMEKTIVSNLLVRHKLETIQANFEHELVTGTTNLQKRAALLAACQEYFIQLDQTPAGLEQVHYTIRFFEEYLGADNILFFQLDPEKGRYTLQYEAGSDPTSRTDRISHFRLKQPGTPGALIDSTRVQVFQNKEDYRPLLFSHEYDRFFQTVLIPVVFEDSLEGFFQAFYKDDGAINEEMVNTYKSIGARLGAALALNRRLEQTQRRLRDLQEKQEKSLQQSWRSQQRVTNRQYGYRCVRNQSEVASAPGELARKALTDGVPMVTALCGEQDASIVVMPIVVRNQTLGALEIQIEGKTVPKDMLNMITAASKRLSLAIENARLLEEIQDRAEREHTLSEITARVRAHTEIDGILKAAATEIGQALRVSDVLVQLRPESETLLSGEPL